MTNKSCDFLVIGAGVIGLAIAREILLNNKNSKVIVVEKETEVGLHASGRNSGVLHAGFYYSPDSLKAKFCSSGNQALTQLIKRHDLSLRKTGKIVVTQDRSQLDDLVALQQRGVATGVNLEILEGSELKKFEPLAQTCEAFIWSPNTSVADPSEVIAAMASEYENLGGVIYFNQSVEAIDDGHIVLDSKVCPADLVINCAGTQALRLARGQA